MAVRKFSQLEPGVVDDMALSKGSWMGVPVFEWVH